MIVTCVDVGSTYTKAIAVQDGRLVSSAAHRTTVESDVLHGLDAAVAATGVKPDELLVCSSAGGGLRLAVIGYERLVTAQAGARVGLSAGAKVVHVAAGKLSSLDDLRAARPDVVLLVGGTDGGDAETISHNAARLARARWRVPVVLAGNASVTAELTDLLAAKGVPVTAASNVLPRIGVLDPGPARAAIREVFLKHVIGGKKLSRGSRFASLVRGATPDLVLTGVELLATMSPGDLLVVDVGGATTDVYSVLKRDHAEPKRPPRTGYPRTTLRDAALVDAALRETGAAQPLAGSGDAHAGVRGAADPLAGSGDARVGSGDARVGRGDARASVGGGDARAGGGNAWAGVGNAWAGVGGAHWEMGAEVAGTMAAARTVEGDLGMRWSAPGVVAAAVQEKLIDVDEDFRAVAERLAAQPETIVHPRDGDLAGLAVAVALRRHARGEPLEPGGPRRGGRDLRAVQTVVGSGGVLRHSGPEAANRILARGLQDDAGGWPLPRSPRVVVDHAYVLAAAGLLASNMREMAWALLQDRLLDG